MRALLRALLPLTLLCAAPASAAEIDVHLSTSLPGVAAVKLEAVPVESGPTAAASITAPSDVEASGGEKVEGMLEPLVDENEGESYSYPLLFRLFDIFGGPVELKDDDTPYDTTPIVDIFIDTDCEDCGDYDFTVPNPPGGHPTSIRGSLELLGTEGDARWRVQTEGNDPKRPVGWAEITLMDSLDPGAPAVQESFAVVPLDKLTYEFTSDLVFKGGEPAGRNYNVAVSWLDAKGVQIGQKEIFPASAVVARTRKDGTKIYKPWRFNSDLAVVVGESWTVEAMTDTYLDAKYFEYAISPLDGGPKLEKDRYLIKEVGEYRLKAQARGLTSATEIKGDHVWSYNAQLKDKGGKAIGPIRVVRMYSWNAWDAGMKASCDSPDGVCIQDLSLRLEDDGTATVTSRFSSPIEYGYLELTPAKDGTTGPALKQGDRTDLLVLEIDVSRVLFRQDFSMIFPSGLDSTRIYTYSLKTAFLDTNFELLGEEGYGELILQRNGQPWSWSESRGIEIFKIRR